MPPPLPLPPMPPEALKLPLPIPLTEPARPDRLTTPSTGPKDDAKPRAVFEDGAMSEREEGGGGAKVNTHAGRVIQQLNKKSLQCDHPSIALERVGVGVGVRMRGRHRKSGVGYGRIPPPAPHRTAPHHALPYYHHPHEILTPNPKSTLPTPSSTKYPTL